MVQWVRLRAPSAGGPGSIPGQGAGSRMRATAGSPHAKKDTGHPQLEVGSLFS